nr:hypothetical protein [Atlantibacter sp.]
MTHKKRTMAPRKATPEPDGKPTVVKAPLWGYEEMLTELEAIVSDAEKRLEEEEL